ncbi:MAG: pilus assembly protein [Gammaproteobacteria bacterium]|nr:pilus assembly protein [Gammaproteobacteria bacterium]
MRKFEGSDRTAFFASLYDHAILTSGTPLRRALDDVGQYFSRTDNSGPWSDTPGTSSTSAHLACRQSYNILMTDGYWNGAAAPTNSGSVNATNADNKTGPTITGPELQSYQYTAANPYQGLNANSTQQNNTLADVAMYYWNRDLRPNIDNLVPTNPVDEAFWQHLVNFTVGLGVMGNLDPDADLPALTAGTKRWPAPSDGGTEENIDDLWHAAVNSRGGFFSAADPDDFATKLADGLAQIVGRVGSSAAVATNSTRLNSDTFVYQAKFDSDGWIGKLLGFRIKQDDGSIIDEDTNTTELDPAWEASALLDSRSTARKIYTHEAADSTVSGTLGVDFLWDADFPAAFKTYLNVGPAGVDAAGSELGEKRLEYISGDQSLEISAGGTFRNRISILADIVNSDPTFAGLQDYGYNLLPGTEGSSYITYRNSSAYKTRPGVVYVGANGGMLHAFEGDSGKELFAYIPEEMVPGLWKLTDPDYSHRFFVDGAATTKDVYLNSSWQTVVVGSTGAGGRSIFALDVSDPAGFDKDDVMWEFTSSTDSDLGYTVGQPSVVRMADGSWAAVFGNGYDSTNDRAMLFIVDMATGSLIRKIDTGVGDATTPNGLATPLLVDTNEDRIADRAYAGDLLGNMWAFDLSNTSNTNKWDIAYKSGSDYKPLFSALDEDDVAQPITAKPQSGTHPEGGVMVYFGTGKYFESGDGSAIRKNTFYGIRDDFSTGSSARVTGGRSSLLHQVITHETYDDSSGNSQLSDGDTTNDIANPFPYDVRVTTENLADWDVHKGWYIDLESPLPSRGWEGERVVSAPLLLENRIVFSTVIPDPDPCKAGGTSWLMELSSVDGARLSVTPFDLNNDGNFDSADYVTIWVTDAAGVRKQVKIPTSGKRSKVGIIKTPAVIKTKEKEFKFTSGSSGDIERTLESRSYRDGRQSWRQLR